MRRPHPERPRHSGSRRDRRGGPGRLGRRERLHEAPGESVCALTHSPAQRPGILFLVQPATLACASLTRSPQAFSVSGCPSATTLRPSTLTFLAAFRSLRWCVPHPEQGPSRSESERSSFLYPHAEQSFDGKNLP